MKEIVIISGKGGTGKTSITASFGYLGGSDVIIADCDVDAADIHLLLEADHGHSEDFYSGEVAIINNEKCSKCGECGIVCRFDAVHLVNNEFTIFEMNCEGCGYCYNICPAGAIEKRENLAGKFYISKTRLNNTLVHAKLNIAAENSGKLVSKVKKEAKLLAEKTKIPYIIIDGSPGIGCPVIASLTGADFSVIVTEPTVSGLHDMKRVYELIKRFGIKSGCIINKADLNKNITDEIKVFMQEKGIILLAELPYNNVFSRAIISGKTVVEYDTGNIIRKQISKSWEKIKEIVKQ